MKEKQIIKLTPKQITAHEYYLKIRDTPKYKTYRKAYQKAYQKTDKWKAYHKAYQKTDKWKAYKKAYQKTYKKKFLRDNIHKFNFITTDGISQFMPEWILTEKTREGK